jgi:hypothetical protein
MKNNTYIGLYNMSVNAGLLPLATLAATNRGSLFYTKTL